MADVREISKNTLKKQSTDQLKNKLAKGKLMGVSKEVAEEIIAEREGKASTKTEAKKTAPKAEKVSEKTETKVVEKKVKEKTPEKAPKEKKEKVKKENKNSFDTSTENPKIKKGVQVSFEHKNTKENVTGEVVSIYKWTTKKGVEKEAAIIKNGDSKYHKNVEKLSVVKTKDA